MFVAAYRNTERGIAAARARKAAVLPFAPQAPKSATPPKAQKTAADRALEQAVAKKFEQYLAEIAAEQALRMRQQAQRAYRARFDVIVRRLCRVFRVSPLDLCSARRGGATVHARQAVYYWAWRLCGLSSPQIGRRLGGRDHTTVLHGIVSYQKKRALMGRNLRQLRGDS
ncbi:helix-turn-helix domain-containing protein [Pseudochrobactrum sp. HB0163]|uniref:helix-turn-helix domain-containing protein n=1 Tax=Pseudochrobactrum sp. HB0163 TaxID=3450708 RepID=UPI003F6E2536